MAKEDAVKVSEPTAVVEETEPTPAESAAAMGDGFDEATKAQDAIRESEAVPVETKDRTGDEAAGLGAAHRRGIGDAATPPPVTPKEEPAATAPPAETPPAEKETPASEDAKPAEEDAPKTALELATARATELAGDPPAGDAPKALADMTVEEVEAHLASLKVKADPVAAAAPVEPKAAAAPEVKADEVVADAEIPDITVESVIASLPEDQQQDARDDIERYPVMQKMFETIGTLTTKAARDAVAALKPQAALTETITKQEETIKAMVADMAQQRLFTGLATAGHTDAQEIGSSDAYAEFLKANPEIAKLAENADPATEVVDYTLILNAFKEARDAGADGSDEKKAAVAAAKKKAAATTAAEKAVHGSTLRGKSTPPSGDALPATDDLDAGFALGTKALADQKAAEAARQK